MSDNQQFCLRWNNHQSTLVQVIDNLLSSGVLVDCTLAAEGQYLHAHKVVLCACSPYLETLLSQHYEKHPIVILKDVKFQELKSMMDYMYKGEVNISQDQLGQFLKAAESLQIKGLTDGGGGEGDTRDVGSTSQKRHEPAPARKTIPHNQSRSPVVLPPHASGLTIEPSKRTLPTHLSESQPDSPIRSREGSTSPTPRKRRRPRRLSQGEEDGHADNSCDLPMQSQSMSITSVPSSIPALPSGSSSTITKAPPPDEDSENPESDRISGLPEGLLKEKIEPQSEMLIEPKTEYMDETNNDDSVEDLTLDDDDEYEGMMEGGAGPSHGSSNPNENYAAWQQMTGDRQDDAYLNPADTGHRDSQGCEVTIVSAKSTSRKPLGLIEVHSEVSGQYGMVEIVSADPDVVLVEDNSVARANRPPSPSFVDVGSMHTLKKLLQETDEYDEQEQYVGTEDVDDDSCLVIDERPKHAFTNVFVCSESSSNYDEDMMTNDRERLGRKLRKMEQNKKAATRYRERKKQELEEWCAKERLLIDRNQKLRALLSQLSHHVECFRALTLTTNSSFHDDEREYTY